MRRWTGIFILSMILTTFSAKAAPDPAGATLVPSSAPTAEWNTDWNLIAGFWNWTEPLSLKRNSVAADDWANLQAQAFGVGYRNARGRWGYGAEALFLNGQASGGGTSAIVYQESRVNFIGYAAKPFGVYRLDRFVEFGLAAPLLVRDLHWPVVDPTLSVTTRTGFMVTYLVFLNVRPTRDFMIHAGIGPAFDPQSSIFNLQLEYFL